MITCFQSAIEAEGVAVRLGVGSFRQDLDQAPPLA
jgi:hypothetical protein